MTGTQLSRRRRAVGGRSELEWVMSIAFAPNGDFYAIGTNEPAAYVGTETMQSPAFTPLHGPVEQLAWSADGALLATRGLGTGSAIAVWADPTAPLINPFGPGPSLARTFPAPAGGFLGAMAWDPSAQLIAMGGSDGELMLWNVPAAAEEQRLVPHQGAAVIGAEWRQDVLVTAGAYPDRTFRVWGRGPGSQSGGGGDPATIVAQAEGPHVDVAIAVFSLILRGPDDQRLARSTGRFDPTGRCTFGALPPGRYWLTPDTKADVPWPVRPPQAQVLCLPGRTQDVSFRFG
jgi:WD domain, G-beta repeat